MAKLKTNRGAAKRFKKTGKGGLKHMASGRRHLLLNKSRKRKRNLRGMKEMHPSDRLSVQRMLLIK